MKTIAFTADMVQKIMCGVKTVTRRPLNPPPAPDFESHPDYEDCTYFPIGDYGFCDSQGTEYFAPYKPGDILWVREPAILTGHEIQYFQSYFNFKYVADDSPGKCRVPSRLESNFGAPPSWVYKLQGIPNGCLREMARTFLKIVSISVETLQEITEEDACQEGMQSHIPGEMEPTPKIGYRHEFKKLWDKMYSQKGLGWEQNPWVWRIEFKKIEGNQHAEK
jgi:hypothetical protein